MKRLITSVLAVAMGLNVLAQTQKVTATVENDVPQTASVQAPRHVALVVQNHAARGTNIPFMALTDELTAKLSGCGFRVINPYNSIGVNQNRNALGEQTPPVSAMELARKLRAHGAITASVIEFLDSTLGTPPILHQYSIRISLSLADAQTGAVVCGEIIETNSLKYTNNQIAQNKAKYLGDLMYIAAEECAERLKRNPKVKAWRPTPPPSPTPLPPPDNRAIFEKIIDELTGEMLADSTFNTKYNELKTRWGRIPIAIIGGVKNESGRTDFDAGLKVAGLRFRKKLYETKMFDIKADDTTETAVAERLVKAVGTEKDDLIDELKQHGSPDLYVVWELIHSADLDGTGYYNFVLTISHLRRPGGVFWTGLYTLKLPRKEVSK